MNPTIDRPDNPSVSTSATSHWELPDLALRSTDANWDHARWATLPADGARYEVINGVLYMTTAPSAFHQWIIRQIVRVLFAQVDDTGVGVTLWGPIGLFMPGCDPVQPDIVVIPASGLDIIHDRRIFGAPALIVEVLSPPNADLDTAVKRAAYARAGVPEYWIIRPAARDVIVYSRPDTVAAEYLQSDHVVPDADLRSATLPLQVPVASFFAGAPDTTL